MHFTQNIYFYKTFSRRYYKIFNRFYSRRIKLNSMVSKNTQQNVFVFLVCMSVGWTLMTLVFGHSESEYTIVESVWLVVITKMVYLFNTKITNETVLFSSRRRRNFTYQLLCLGLFRSVWVWKKDYIGNSK